MARCQRGTWTDTARRMADFIGASLLTMVGAVTKYLFRICVYLLRLGGQGLNFWAVCVPD